MSRLRARLRYFAGDAFDEFRHSPGVNTLATATLTAALFVGGLMLLVLANLERNLERWQQDLRVQVYLADDQSTQDRAVTRRRLTEVAGVEDIEFVDKRTALERFRASFGEDLAGLTGELDANPLPASFEVMLNPRTDATEAATRILAALEGVSGVEEVRFDEQWLAWLGSMLRGARLGSAAVAAVVFGAVVLVMASVLRLAVYARSDEIEIVQLVGATPGFVRGPFVVAGLVQGLVGALLALALLEGLRRGALAWAGADPVALLTLLCGRGLPWSYGAMLVLIGLIVGFAGSYFAVRTSVGVR